MTTKQPPIHIFNNFQNRFGGSENEALELYRDLSKAYDVTLWGTSSRIDATLQQQHGITLINPLRAKAPKGGIYIFVGAHWCGKWWAYLLPKPQRLIYFYNTFHPKHSQLIQKRRPLLNWPAPELIFISRFQRDALNLCGKIHPSPIDINKFTPGTEKPDSGPVTIGRMSRDIDQKHNLADIEVYKSLLQGGHQVKLQGASCLEPALAETGATLYQEGELDALNFLQALDIFYYRSGEHTETFGRVIFEAMACGLPVVCHRHGGYAEWIQSGENGFLFDTTEQALAILRRLSEDPGLRNSVGKAARKTVESIYAQEAKDIRLASLLSPAKTPASNP
ncbi:glycosyltransferase family 4 protein [Gilvimarinus agarilyticus]|uniref:glycosyltransferase family 4 protein n=1 Tax=Gilvimarinus agarilyticus TaxID=679259 RepID=UPI000B30099A|nr:glycosyltransferase family 4 protein [Gilvimarinus agarilyticus]